MTERARRQHGEGSFRELPNGTWEGKQRVNGQRVYAYGATWKEAASQLRQKVAKADRGIDPQMLTKPLRVFLAAWLATEPGTTPKGRASYEWAVRLHILPRIGDIRLGRLTEADVERMMRECMTKPLPPATKVLSARSATIVRNTLRAALNWGIKSRLLTENAAALATAPPARSRKARPLTQKEADRLLAHVAGARWHALYTLALATALREGELLGLRWQDVDFAGGMIHVRQQGQYVPGSGMTPRELKTASSQDSVPLPQFAALALVGHRERQERERQLADGWQEQGLVFPSTAGTMLAARNLYRRWVLDAAAVDLGDRHFHDLRASTASILHARGVPMRTIQRILRHARMSTTADLYTHVFDDTLTEAATALDAAFRSPSTHPLADASGVTPGDTAATPCEESPV